MTRLLCLLLCLLGTTAHAQTYRNCGQDWTLPHAPPQRILALNQHAADLLLALQVGPSLVAVSYIDDDTEALASRRYRGVPCCRGCIPRRRCSMPSATTWWSAVSPAPFAMAWAPVPI